MSDLQEPIKLLFVARCAFEVYQDCHWRVEGDAAYGKHLLFQRLYEETLPHVDKVAEHLVGMWGGDVLREGSDHRRQAEKTATSLLGEEPTLAAVAIASDLEESIRTTYSVMERKGLLSRGWDDVLATFANTVESHLYLLGRTLGH